MTHIKLFRRGEGCEVPDGSEYLLVTSHEVDAHGQWLPTDVRAVETMPQLEEALKRITASADAIVVQASSQFERLATDLGLRLLTSEWGNL